MWKDYLQLRTKVRYNRLKGWDNMHPANISLWRKIYLIEALYPEFHDRYALMFNDELEGVYA